MNRILIASSDGPLVEAAQAALGTAGYHTAVVTNANELIEFCRQHQPDLIVIDLELAGGSVWAAAKTLRNFPNTAKVPFLGLGSQLSDMEVLHAQSMGFAHFEPKPINPESFCASTQSILQASNPAQNSPAAAAPPPHPNCRHDRGRESRRSTAAVDQ